MSNTFCIFAPKEYKSLWDLSLTRIMRSAYARIETNICFYSCTRKVELKVSGTMAGHRKNKEKNGTNTTTGVAAKGAYTVKTTPDISATPLAMCSYELAKRAVERSDMKCEYGVEQIRKEFLDYVQYFNSHSVTYQRKRKSVEYTGASSGTSEHIEQTERVVPMTEVSFSAWLGKPKWWLTDTISRIKGRDCRLDGDIEMLHLLQAIQSFLSSQLLEGALAGEFPANIVSTMLGLRTAIDVTSEDKAIQVPIINIVPDDTKRKGGSQEALDQIKAG